MNRTEAEHLVDVHLDAARLVEARCDRDFEAFWTVLGTSDALAVELILGLSAIAAAYVDDQPDPAAVLALIRRRIVSSVSPDEDTP